MTIKFTITQVITTLFYRFSVVMTQTTSLFDLYFDLNCTPVKARMGISDGSDIKSVHRQTYKYLSEDSKPPL